MHAAAEVRLRCKQAAPGLSAVYTWLLASSSCGSEVRTESHVIWVEPQK